MTTIRTVRLLRKAFALTQGELADLLAISQTIVSRIEAGEEPPTLETALALQVLFDVEPRLLFHRRYLRIEDAVMQRAAQLDQRIAGKADAASLKKQELLASVVKRARPGNDE
jgi:transcriptional regulator with XRE-family HTH domain